MVLLLKLDVQSRFVKYLYVDVAAVCFDAFHLVIIFMHHLIAILMYAFCLNQ